MRRLLAAVLLLGVLGVADAAIAGRFVARFGRRVWRWSTTLAWSGTAMEPETWHVWSARGRDGAPRVVVHGSKSVEVWSASGQRASYGAVPWGTDVGLGDLDGDGIDEIAVATESQPPDAPVSVQVVDQALDPVTPNVGVLEGLEVPASVGIVPFAGGAQVVVADFRGCLVSLVQADMVWERCFPDAKEGGDPYAIRHLAAVEAGGRRLVAAGRATGEVGVLDDEGRFVWSVRTAEPLRAFTAVRGSDGTVVFAGGEQGAYAVLDAEKGAARGSGRLPGMVMVARAIVGSRGQARAIVAGGLAEPAWRGLSGYVAVIGMDGRVRARFPVDGQVMDLAAVDLDGDGEDEIAAVTGAYRLMVLTPDGRLLWQQRVDDPSNTKVAPAGTGDASRLIVAGSGRVQAWRGVREQAPWWYAPIPAAVAVGALLTLALAAVVSLSPPPPVR